MQLPTPPFSFVLGIGKLNSQEFSITCGTRIRVKIHIRKILWRGEVTKVMQWSLARQCVASKKKYFQCRHHFLPILWWGKCKDIKIGPHPQCHIECLDFDIWEKEQKTGFRSWTREEIHYPSFRSCLKSNASFLPRWSGKVAALLQVLSGFKKCLAKSTASKDLPLWEFTMLNSLKMISSSVFGENR